jgi:hypothetical protein
MKNPVEERHPLKRRVFNLVEVSKSAASPKPDHHIRTSTIMTILITVTNIELR